MSFKSVNKLLTAQALLEKWQKKPQSLAEINPLAEIHYLATRQATRLQQLANTTLSTNLTPLLNELQQVMMSINPRQYSLTTQSLRGYLSQLLPWVNSPLQCYCVKYQSQQAKITPLIQQLNTETQQLQRDVKILQYDADDNREYIQQLSNVLKDANTLSHQLVQLSLQHKQRLEIEQQLMTPLQQRIIDLNLQLTVSEQALLSIQLIIDNNQQLINTVRQLNGSILSMLHVSTGLSVHLAKQKNLTHFQDSFNSIEQVFQKFKISK